MMAGTCVWCSRPLCEDFVTRILMTGDGNPRCPESGDGWHHLEVPQDGRVDFIVRMARVAAEEPQEFHGGDDLVTRTMHYTSSAVPPVTAEEIEKALGGACVDHSECVAAEPSNPRGHIHEGKPGWWLWPDEVGKDLYAGSPTGA
jgi:hypothetical protein